MSRQLIRAIVLALAVSALRPAHAVDPQDAFAHYKAGRYLEAVTEFQALVDRFPAYHYGYFMLGHCNLKMRAPMVAESHFRHAIELDPTRPEYYLGLALALADEASWERTIQVLSEGLARAQDPHKRYNLLLLRAEAWHALQRWDLVVNDLEVAKRIQQNPALFELLGKAYFGNGNAKAAISPLLFALEASPEDTGVLRVLSESYLRVGADEPDVAKKRIAYSRALVYAQRLAALTPDNLEVVHLVGRAALGAGQLERAEAIFRHVLDREPQQCYAMINLGRTLFAAEKYPEAQAWLVRAEGCAPREGSVYETLGNLYFKLGRPDEAAAAFRRASELSSADGSLRTVGKPRGPGNGTISVSAPR